MSEETISVASQDDIDKTVIADIARNKQPDKIEDVENKNSENIIDLNIINIKPHPEPNTEKNISELVESYNPSQAVIELDSKNKNIEKTIDWDKAQDIAFWYTDESKVRNLIGKTVKFNKKYNKIYYPDDPKDYVSRLSHTIILSMLNYGFIVENRPSSYVLDPKSRDLSVVSLAIISTAILNIYLSNFGHLDIVDVPYGFIMVPFGLLLTLIFVPSVLASIYLSILRISSVFSTFRKKYLRIE